MEKIHIRIILEILGRPPEHILESLGALITKMGSEKGIKVIDKKIHEAVKVKDADNLYTSFAEVELEVDTIDHYFAVIFTYLPANIEIISPESLKMTNSDLMTVGNALTERLHNYDGIAKRLVGERDILINQIRILREAIEKHAPHLIQKKDAEVKKSPKKKPKKSKK